jgi:hypothetical protein
MTLWINQSEEFALRFWPHWNENSMSNLEFNVSTFTVNLGWWCLTSITFWCRCISWLKRGHKTGCLTKCSILVGPESDILHFDPSPEVHPGDPNHNPPIFDSIRRKFQMKSCRNVSEWSRNWNHLPSLRFPTVSWSRGLKVVDITVFLGKFEDLNK